MANAGHQPDIREAITESVVDFERDFIEEKRYCRQKAELSELEICLCFDIKRTQRQAGNQSHDERNDSENDASSDDGCHFYSLSNFQMFRCKVLYSKMIVKKIV